MIQGSFIFSYWLLVWFILYFISVYIHKYTQKYSLFNWIYQNANPFVTFLFGVVFSICFFSYVLYYNHSPSMILFVFLIVLFEKIIPVYWLSFYPVHFYKNSLLLFISLFIYLVYIYVNNTNAYKVYINIADSMIQNKYNTPFLHMIQKIFL